MAAEQRLARGGIVLALAVLVGIGALSYQSSVQQVKAADLVAHTHEVIGALQDVFTGVAASESGLRGYAIMKDVRFMTDFEPGIFLAQRGLASALHLTLDNPAQQRVVTSLSPLLQERIRLLRNRRGALEGGAPASVPTEALLLSEHIRSMVNQAIATERDLLRERSGLAAREASRARLTMLFGISVSCLLVGLASYRVEREMGQRRQAQQGRLHELSLLLELGELLQSCRSTDEAFEVIRRIGPRFFPIHSGSISLFQASRNAVNIKAVWGDPSLAGKQVFEPQQCWGLRRGQLHYMDTEGDGMPCEHLPESRPLTAACLPLIANGELLGAFHLSGTQPLAEEARQRIGVFGEQVGLAVANLELRETLRNQSIRDPLTGLFNRRYTEETCHRELARAAREKTELSLLMLDIDHFKKFNDSYGHETGDEVLKQISVVLQQQTRIGDVVSRMGGEELLVILPGSSLTATLAKAEQLRAKIEALALRSQGKAIDTVTVSIGVATFPAHGSAMDELTRAADAALYRAKHAGRNRVVVAE